MLDGDVRTLIHLRRVKVVEVRRDPPCAEDRAFTLRVLLADKLQLEVLHGRVGRKRPPFRVAAGLPSAGEPVAAHHLATALPP